MDALSMPEGSKKLIKAHAAAQRGDASKAERVSEAETAFTAGPIGTLFLGLVTFGAGVMSWNLFVDDPMWIDDFNNSILGGVSAACAVICGAVTIGFCHATLAGILKWRKLVFDKQYRHRRMPDEEEVLKDRLILDTLELDRQVKIYEDFCREIEFQDRKAKAGLPTSLDVVRGQQIAGELHDQLEPKLKQLDLLIEGRNRKASGDQVDLVALRETLNGHHGHLLAELKAQQELDGDPAEYALHSALLYDDVNAELGDPTAAARNLAARLRRAQ